MKAGLLKITSLILLLALIASCVGNHKYASADTNRSTRIANLKRAIQLPWVDGGRCVVQEASNEWPVVVERCFYALDLQKIRFENPAEKCAIASVDTVMVGSVGKCLLAAMPVPLAAAPLAPAAGPVMVVAGVMAFGVVAAILIVEALDYYDERRAHPEADTSRETTRPAPQAVPAPTSRPDDSPKAYVVRFQAQGGGTEESVVLVWPTPITTAAGISGLETLKGKLSTNELRLRADLFQRAERFIRNAPTGGGVGPPGKSFALPRSDVRVDVEILRGINFQK